MPLSPLNPRPIPDRLRQWKQLLPPQYDYGYFAAGGGNAFEPAATGHSLLNATVLADLSLLAYAPPEFALDRLMRAKLGDAQFIEQAGSRAYLIESDELAVAAFRGTEVNHPKHLLLDLKTDLDFARRPAAGVPGHVHGGFEKALDEVWDRIGPPLARAAARGARVWLTGHSLGAAMATLAGVRLASAQGIYAYASPRVGDAEFAAAAGQSNLLRFVFSRDLVPRMPPRVMGFEHGGTRIFIGEDGRVRPEPEPPRLGDEPGMDQVVGRWKEAVGLNLFDHSPVLYAAHLWNAFVAG